MAWGLGSAQLQMPASKWMEPVDQQGVNSAVLSARAPDQDQKMTSASDLHGISARMTPH
jgi:hypothetical protein